MTGTSSPPGRLPRCARTSPSGSWRSTANHVADPRFFPQLRVPADENLILTFHFYDPLLFHALPRPLERRQGLRGPDRLSRRARLAEELGRSSGVRALRGPKRTGLCAGGHRARARSGVGAGEGDGTTALVRRVRRAGQPLPSPPVSAGTGTCSARSSDTRSPGRSGTTRAISASSTLKAGRRSYTISWPPTFGARTPVDRDGTRPSRVRGENGRRKGFRSRSADRDGSAPVLVNASLISAVPIPSPRRADDTIKTPRTQLMPPSEITSAAPTTSPSSTATRVVTPGATSACSTSATSVQKSHPSELHIEAIGTACSGRNATIFTGSGSPSESFVALDMRRAEDAHPTTHCDRNGDTHACP